MTGMRNSDLPDDFKETKIGPIPVDREVVRLVDVLLKHTPELAARYKVTS